MKKANTNSNERKLVFFYVKNESALISFRKCHLIETNEMKVIKKTDIFATHLISAILLNWCEKISSVLSFVWKMDFNQRQFGPKKKKKLFAKMANYLRQMLIFVVVAVANVLYK